MRVESLSKIAFIGFLAGAMPLVGLPSNPGRRVLVEGGIIAIAAVVVYVVYNSVYGRIIQESPPDIVNTFSLAVATVLIVSYVAFRWGDVLWKAKGRWLGWPFKVAAITVLAGLILIAVTYP